TYVQYKTTNGTAKAGDDYSAAAGWVQFYPWESPGTSVTVTVPLTGDNLAEANETFNVVLSKPAYGSGTLSDATGVATIVNDDAPAYLSVDNVSVTEGSAGSTPVSFTVTRSGNTTGASTVKYKTSGGTAAAGSDYTAVGLDTLEFADGETSKTVTVDVLGDIADEINETFNLVLSAPTGAVVADGSGTAYIVDDEGTVKPAPATFLAIDNVSVNEGDSAATASFTVSRSGDTSGASTVKYKTSGGTATSGVDYTGVGLTTLTFAADETSKTVTVDVTSDTLPEKDETFNVSLSGATGAAIADATGTATITNDDGYAYLVVDDVWVNEGNSGTTSATFTVTRSGNTTGA
ncbi:MAG: calcium-binding protein, partial [Actinobacteria bacterium]|nr:calcium-binding protein [Actinomycetota bacterium]